MRFRKIAPEVGEDSAYEVLVDGRVIGEVFSLRQNLSQGLGRARAGHERLWATSLDTVTGYDTRAQAADSLLRQQR